MDGFLSASASLNSPWASRNTIGLCDWWVPGILFPIIQLELKSSCDLSWSHEYHTNRHECSLARKSFNTTHTSVNMTQGKVHAKPYRKKTVGKRGFQLSIIWSFKANQNCTSNFVLQNLERENNNNCIYDRKCHYSVDK